MASVLESHEERFFSCAICRRRKPAQDYPFDKDYDVRVTITCTQCLGENGVRHSGQLIDQLALDPDNLTAGSAADISAPLKRKRSNRGSDSLTTHSRRKRTDAVQLVSPPASVTCSICYDDKGAADFPAKPPGPRAKAWAYYNDAPIACAGHVHCKSTTPVCKDCISKSFTAAIDIKDAEKLGCPTEHCNNSWDQHFIRQYLSEEVFKHYSEILFQQYIAKRTIFYCVDQKCAHGGLVEIQLAGGYPNLECVACKKRACALCKVEWHHGKTCQEFREEHGEGRSEEELQVLRKMAHAGAKRCSNCQLAVEKDGGCDYMWCPHCRQQFFWSAAEPVRATPKNTRSKKEYADATPRPVNPLARPCESDRLAEIQAAIEAGTLPPPGPPRPGFPHHPAAPAFQRRIVQLHQVAQGTPP